MTVQSPKTTNMIRQFAMQTVSLLTNWKPKEVSAPMIWPTPTPQYQMLNRRGCSCLAYH